jgi:hypothetical protein
MLFINPRTDAAFAELVEREAAAATSAEDLRVRLSASYPRILVRQRALEGERAEIWYVYRDGRWVAD